MLMWLNQKEIDKIKVQMISFISQDDHLLDVKKASKRENDSYFIVDLNDSLN